LKCDDSPLCYADALRSSLCKSPLRKTSKTLLTMTSKTKEESKRLVKIGQEVAQRASGMQLPCVWTGCM
jgi:hypothetical protein